MYRKWHGFLALASADHNYPCNIAAGQCYCDALGWWMLWEVKQSLLIIGSLRCCMALRKMVHFLPWKDHRTWRNQCSAPILPSALSSSSAWKSCCPTVNWATAFCGLKRAFSYSCWEGKPALSLSHFQSFSQDCRGDQAAEKREGRKAGPPTADRMAAT